MEIHVFYVFDVGGVVGSSVVVVLKIKQFRQGREFDKVLDGAFDEVCSHIKIFHETNIFLVKKLKKHNFSKLEKLNKRFPFQTSIVVLLPQVVLLQM